MGEKRRVMAQDPINSSRREFVHGLIGLLPAAAISAGVAADATLALAADGAAYTPVYFTADEMAFITAAAGCLIPAEAPGAGAVQAGVPEFIDRQMLAPYGQGKLMFLEGPADPMAPAIMGWQFPYGPAELYRRAIAGVNVWTQQQHQKDFSQLDEATQVSVLTAMEEGKVTIEGIPSGAFFDTLLDNVKQGYFSDPQYGGNRGMAGWKMIGYPGARADFADWAGQHNKKYPLGPVDIAGETA